MAGRPNVQQSAPEYLEPPQEVIEKYLEYLVKFYSNLPKFKDDPIKKANEVIETCKTGWRCCPKTFEARIKAKTERTKFLKSYGTRKQIAAAEIAAEEKLISDTLALPSDGTEELIEKNKKTSAVDEYLDAHLGRETILKNLSSEDRKFFQQRERFYRKEFEFNNSSDYALLIEVIIDELKIQKIHEIELWELKQASPNELKLLNLSKMISEAHKRLSDSLERLGVTRDQRKDEMEASVSTLTSLVMNLEQKLKSRDAIHRRELAEEEEGLRRKYLRGDVYPEDGLPRALHNRIPDTTNIQKLIDDAGIREFNVDDDSSVS